MKFVTDLSLGFDAFMLISDILDEKASMDIQDESTRIFQMLVRILSDIV